jgi:hypothetical protein
MRGAWQSRSHCSADINAGDASGLRIIGLVRIGRPITLCFGLPVGLLLWYPFFMGRSIKGTTKKRRGRPATTGKGTQIGMRWQEPLLSAIDSWMGTHDVATRPEAIRRLVEIGLKAKK